MHTEKSAQTKNNIRSTPDNQYKINAQIHQQDSSSSLALSIATTIGKIFLKYYFYFLLFCVLS